MGELIFQIVKKMFFLVLVVLGEYEMNQKNIGGFVVGLTSTNFGEASSKFSHNYII